MWLFMLIAYDAILGNCSKKLCLLPKNVQALNLALKKCRSQKAISSGLTKRKRSLRALALGLGAKKLQPTKNIGLTISGSRIFSALSEDILAPPFCRAKFDQN